MEQHLLVYTPQLSGVFHTLVQPYKKKWHSLLELFLFISMIAVITLTLFNYDATVCEVPRNMESLTDAFFSSSSSASPLAISFATHLLLL